MEVMETWELIISIGLYIFLLIMSFLIGRIVGEIKQLKRCSKDLEELTALLTNKQEE